MGRLTKEENPVPGMINQYSIRMVTMKSALAGGLFTAVNRALQHISHPAGQSAPGAVCEKVFSFWVEWIVHRERIVPPWWTKRLISDGESDRNR